MKVIICGAGEVGGNIAVYLSNEDNDVTLIDIDKSALERVSERCDLRTVCGVASHPDVLESAGAYDAEMIIAVTRSDEVNMMACQSAHSLFNIPKKIARIRQREYLNPAWSKLFTKEHVPIDVIISPEYEVAKAIVSRIEVPGALNLNTVMDGEVNIIGLICREDCPILNTPMKNIPRLFPEITMSVMAVVRENKIVLPSADDMLYEDDEVYFAVDKNQTANAMDIFGRGEPGSRRVLIIGGGHVGMSLAASMEELRPDISLKIIEKSEKTADYVSERLSSTTVIVGDALDSRILKEAGAEYADTVAAVTNDDETNILGSLLAKKFGCGRAVTLINKNVYSDLISTLDLDAVVNPHAITVSGIMHFVRRGRIRSVHALRDGFAEVMDLEAYDSSGIVHIAFEDLKLPEGVAIGLVKRGDKLLMPHGSMIIKPKDRVIVFAKKGTARAVERLFSVRSDYF